MYEWRQQDLLTKMWSSHSRVEMTSFFQFHHRPFIVVSAVKQTDGFTAYWVDILHITLRRIIKWLWVCFGDNCRSQFLQSLSSFFKRLLHLRWDGVTGLVLGCRHRAWTTLGQVTGGGRPRRWFYPSLGSIQYTLPKRPCPPPAPPPPTTSLPNQHHLSMEPT